MANLEDYKLIGSSASSATVEDAPFAASSVAGGGLVPDEPDGTRKSEAWHHFRSYNAGRSLVCAHCERTINRTDSSTKSMWSHLETHRDLLDSSVFARKGKRRGKAAAREKENGVGDADAAESKRRRKEQRATAVPSTSAAAVAAANLALSNTDACMSSYASLLFGIENGMTAAAGVGAIAEAKVKEEPTVRANASRSTPTTTPATPATKTSTNGHYTTGAAATTATTFADINSSFISNNNNNIDQQTKMAVNNIGNNNNFLNDMASLLWYAMANNPANDPLSLFGILPMGLGGASMDFASIFAGQPLPTTSATAMTTEPVSPVVSSPRVRSNSNTTIGSSSGSASTSPELRQTTAATMHDNSSSRKRKSAIVGGSSTSFSMSTPEALHAIHQIAVDFGLNYEVHPMGGEGGSSGGSGGDQPLVQFTFRKRNVSDTAADGTRRLRVTECRRHLLLVVDDAGDDVVDVDGTTAPLSSSVETWEKTDLSQLAWALRGKCQKCFSVGSGQPTLSVGSGGVASAAAVAVAATV